MKFAIPEPCNENWNEMERRPDGRFCNRCQHDVIDLARLTKRQAKERLGSEKSRGYACVQLALGPNDEPIFRPEPKRAGWTKSLALAAVLGASGCATLDEPTEFAPVASDEGCPLDPTMTPVAVGPSNDGPTQTGEVIVGQVGGPTVPSEAQRELTESERREQEMQAAQVRHVRGRMPMRSF